MTVADSLLRRGQIDFMKGTVLTISRPSADEEDRHKLPAAVAENDLPPRSIQLSGVPPGTKTETLILFLENKRKCGGGKIQDIDYNESTQTATVTFEDQRSKFYISITLFKQ